MTETPPACIHLPPKLDKILRRLSRKRNLPEWLVQRARIIRLLSQGNNLSETAEQLGISRKTVYRWYRRWQTSIEPLLSPLSKATRKSLEGHIKALLSDAPRSGAPSQITIEQQVQMIALACEDPQDSGLPLSHWSASEIAREAVKRGIVEQISERSVNRLLAEADLKPWLTDKRLY
jgi:transposase